MDKSDFNLVMSCNKSWQIAWAAAWAHASKLYAGNIMLCGCIKAVVVSRSWQFQVDVNDYGCHNDWDANWDWREAISSHRLTAVFYRMKNSLFNLDNDAIWRIYSLWQKPINNTYMRCWQISFLWYSQEYNMMIVCECVSLKRVAKQTHNPPHREEEFQAYFPDCRRRRRRRSRLTRAVMKSQRELSS